MEPITVTRDEIIYQRRVRVLEHAGETGNVSLTCRTFGISRTRFYEWRRLAEADGLEALMPKARRRPQLSNATPSHVIAELLAMAVAEPTIGCRQLADRLTDRGFVVSKTTVQKLLVDHGLGRRSQRVARAAAVAALTGGVVTEPVAEEMLFGFCHWAARPGDLVAVDSFYIGNLKGVGKVYQLTAVDTATRWAIIQIVLGPVTAEHTRRFITHVRRTFGRLGWPLRAVLSDNGPEYKATRFRDHLADLGLTHHRIPARSPNHNAVCERSRAPHFRSAGAPRSTADGSPPSASSKPKPTPGSSATTTAAATTATSWPAGPPDRSSTPTAPSGQHDRQPQRPSVTSNSGQEALGAP